MKAKKVAAATKPAEDSASSAPTPVRQALIILAASTALMTPQGARANTPRNDLPQRPAPVMIADQDYGLLQDFLKRIGPDPYKLAFRYQELDRLHQQGVFAQAKTTALEKPVYVLVSYAGGTPPICYRFRYDDERRQWTLEEVDETLIAAEGGFIHQGDSLVIHV